MPPGLLQLTTVRYQRRTTSPLAVGAERCCAPGLKRSSARPHHTGAAAAALAASPTTDRVQGRRTRPPVTCWCDPRVPRWWLLPAVGCQPSPAAVGFQWIEESASTAHTQQTGWQKLLSRRSPPVERPSTKAKTAGTVIWHLLTISYNLFVWRPKRIVTLSNLYAQYKKTLMYVYMYVLDIWGREMVWVRKRDKKIERWYFKRWLSCLHTLALSFIQ